MSVAVWAVGLQVAGTAFQAFAQYSQGQAQAQTAQYNARMEEYEAGLAVNKADREASAIKRHGESFMSTQRARIGASGLALSGSSLDVLTDTAMSVERDALTARYGGKLKQWQHVTKAGQYRWEGEMATRSARLATGMTLLTGLGSSAVTGYNMGLWGEKA